MGFERISTARAKEHMDAGYVYVDVRTPAEFAAGHPVGALNVPVMVSCDGRMGANDDFVAVMIGIHDKDAGLIVGCATGKRSLVAAEQLVAAGFTRVLELRAGYAGRRGPFGEVEEQGWAAAGLPTELTTVGASYDELRARALR